MNSRVPIVEQIRDVLVNVKVDIGFPIGKYDAWYLVSFPMESITKLLKSISD